MTFWRTTRLPALTVHRNKIRLQHNKRSSFFRIHLHSVHLSLTHFSTFNSSWLQCESSSRNSPSIRSHAGSTYDAAPPSWLIGWNSFSSQNAAHQPLPPTANSWLYLATSPPSGTDLPKCPTWEELNFTTASSKLWKSTPPTWQYTPTTMLEPWEKKTKVIHAAEQRVFFYSMHYFSCQKLTYILPTMELWSKVLSF